MEKRTKRHYVADDDVIKEPIIEKSHAEVETNGPQTKNGIVRNSIFVNVRKEPSLESAVLDTVRRGTKVSIIDTSGSFYKILLGDSMGYISKIYVEEE